MRKDYYYWGLGEFMNEQRSECMSEEKEVSEWAYQHDVKYRLINDGTFEVQVPGFCEDDLDVNIENDVVTFTLSNGKEDVSFKSQVPSTIESMNVRVDKGILSYTIKDRPLITDVNITIGD